MKKSRSTGSKIVAILKEIESGLKVDQGCRNHGISPATHYNWKNKCGGMEASDVKRLKALEEENNRPKKIYAELSLEHQAVKDLIVKKGW